MYDVEICCHEDHSQRLNLETCVDVAVAAVARTPQLWRPGRRRLSGRSTSSTGRRLSGRLTSSTVQLEVGFQGD